MTGVAPPGLAGPLAVGLACVLSGALAGLSVPWYLERCDHPPPAEVTGLVPEPPEGRVRGRILWIVVDGLRVDAVPRMPRTVGLLRGRGAFFQVDVGFPSFSKPVYVELATGVPQRRSGVRNNRWSGPVALDHLFVSLARAGGSAVGILQHIDWWRDLFTPHLGDGGPFRWRGLAARCLVALREHDLVLVHILEVDEASHRWGPKSDGAVAAIARADRFIGEVVPAALARGVTVWIQADHGHVGSGGHGGDEPDARLAPVMVLGPGIVPTDQATRPAFTAMGYDVAPTIAALLGIPAPAQAEGRVVASLGVGFSPRAEAERGLRVVEAWERALALRGPGLHQGRPSAYLDVLQDQEASAARWPRVLGAVVGLLALLGVALWRWGREVLGWVLLGAAFPVAVFLLYRVAGGLVSFSDIDTKARFLARLSVILIAGLAPVAALTWWRLSPMPVGTRLSVVVRLVPIIALPAVWTHVLALAWTGIDDPWAGATGMFLPLITGPAAAAALFSGGVALLAGASWVARCSRSS